MALRILIVYSILIFFYKGDAQSFLSVPVNTNHKNIYCKSRANEVDYRRAAKLNYGQATENTNVRAAFNSVKKKYILKDANVAYSNGIVESTPNNYVLIGQTYDTVGSQLQWRLTLIGVDQNYNMTWKKSYGNNNFNYTHHVFSPITLIKKNNSLYAALFANDSNLKQPGVFLKFDFNGDTIWQKKYYINNDELFITSACPSTDGGFLLTGAVQTNTPGFNNHPIVGSYLLKTDSDGNKLWDKRFYKSNLDDTQAGYKIIQDSASKQILIVGVQDNGTQYSMLQILDSLGNQISQYGNTGNFGSALLDIIKLKDGNFMASGGTTHPDVQIAGFPTSSSTLVKFTPTGTAVFKLDYDTLVVNNCFYKLIEDPNGNIITGGQLSTLMQYNMGINDLSRVMKVRKDGYLIWKKYFDNYNNNSNQDGLSDMQLSMDGNIVFTNYLNGGSVPRPLNYIFFKTDTSYCDANALTCNSYVGLETLLFKDAQIKIFPNPARQKINIELWGENLIESIEAFNSLGEIVYFSNNLSERKTSLETSDYNPGFYFLILKLKNGSIKETKMIIE